MFGLESLLMQAVTSTGNATLDSAVAIVLAVAAIAGIAAQYLKTNQKTNRIGQYLDTFSQKTVEQEENMKRLALASRAAVPELDSKLKEYEVPISTIEKRITAAEAQLEFFRHRTKESERAEHLGSELPRETVRVDPNKTFGRDVRDQRDGAI